MFPALKDCFSVSQELKKLLEKASSSVTLCLPTPHQSHTFKVGEKEQETGSHQVLLEDKMAEK